MSFLTKRGTFPPVPATTAHNVTAEERSSAIDFVNRHNFFFEEFSQDKLKSSVLPDGTIHHFHRTFRGASEGRGFLEEYYPLVPGVTRHATNHIVDRDDETGGVVVRYHNQLIRFAWPNDAKKIKAKTAEAFENTDGLPAIWIWSPMVDRLKMTDEGWKIHEKYIGGTVINKDLTPRQSKI